MRLKLDDHIEIILGACFCLSCGGRLCLETVGVSVRLVYLILAYWLSLSVCIMPAA